MTIVGSGTKRRRRPIRATLGFLARTVAVIVGVLLIAVLWIVVFGFPDRLCDEMTRRVSSEGPFAIEAESVRLNGWDELVFSRARAYRRRVVGPAAAEANEVLVRFDPRALSRREFCLRSIEVRDGILRPFSALAQVRQTNVQDAIDLNFRVPLAVRNFQVQGVTVMALDCTIVGAGPSLSFDGAVASVTNAGSVGVAQGWVRCDLQTGITTGLVHTAFSPLLLEPVFAEWRLGYLVTLLRRFEFTDVPPRIDSGFLVTTGTNYTLALDSQVRIQDGTYRGVPFMRVDGGVHVRYGTDHLTVRVDPLVVVRRDGVVEGRLLVDPPAETIAYDGVSSIHPRALARAIGIFQNDELKPFSFDGAMRILSSGTLDYREGLGRTELDVKGAVGVLGYGDFTIKDAGGTMRMHGLTNTITSFSGEFLDGAVSGRAEVVLPSRPDGRAAYSLDLRLEKADFAKLAALRNTAAKQEFRGRLDANVEMEGLVGVGQGGSVKGRGSVRVRDGQVFSLPIFGGLSSTMAKIIPGLDFVMRQSDAKADFVVRDGKVIAEKVEITGDVLSLTGRGEYTLDGRLDFNVRVTLMKEHTLIGSLLRGITKPISWLFEFRLRGTMDKPEWYPVNFSKDLLEKIGFRDKTPETKAP
jgi:hypothetical protein